ncbi:ABC transporter ATP-binding protein/permease [Treponema sp. OttesenSCG-928-L16]|nr:ABC transporter ATP-binding protein/permease [Treponema sp. OttesenSCG-928-L16]
MTRKQAARMNEKKIGFRNTLKIAGRALGVSLKTMGPLTLFLNILGFAAAFLPVLISQTLARFTNGVQALYQHRGTLTDVLTVFALLMILYVIQTSYNALQLYFSDLNVQRIVKYIKQAIIDNTSKVQFKYIENEDDYRSKLLFSQSYGGRHVAESMQEVIGILRSGISFVSIVIVLSRVNLWIMIILLVTCIPAVILSALQKDEEYKNKSKSMIDAAYSVHLFYLCAGANERLRPLIDMRFTGVFPYLKQKWRDVSDVYLQKKNAVTRKHVIYNSLADILRNIVYIGVLLIAAWQIYSDPGAGLGLFMLVFTMSAQMQTAATRLFAGAANFFGQIVYMKDFFDLDDTPQEVLEENPRPIEQADISFDHVSFSYPGNKREALHDISVSIRQGEKVAIVGENGSGKTTFINLLCGIYEAAQGRILIGNEPISGNLRAVRNAISVVFQSFGRYETTIRENITISAQNPMDDEKIMALAAKTGADEIIKAQARGLDEQVGTYSDTGNNLSGGQWQKIALSRALCREDARVMILDEPTAALDPVAEAQLYRDFEKITGDRTAILISHRLGITSVVDRVIVFQSGQIVEDGSHASLMAANGPYAAMYRAQAQWYK